MVKTKKEKMTLLETIQLVGILLMFCIIIFVVISWNLQDVNEDVLGNTFCKEKYKDFPRFVEFDSYNENRSIIGCKIQRMSGNETKYFKVKKFNDGFYEVPK